MLWLAIVISAYTFLAFSSLVDKYLLTKSRVDPQTFTFYVGALSLLVFLLLPLTGFFLPSLFKIFLSLGSGFFMTYSIFLYLGGLQKFEASRIVPMVGAFVPLFTLAFVAVISQGKDVPSFWGLIAFFLLTAGTFLVTLEKGMTIFNVASFRIGLASAFFGAVGLLMAKYAYLNQDFWSVLFLTRLGAFGFALLLLGLSRELREKLFAKHKYDSPQLGKSKKITIVFLLGQGLGASAEFLRNVAIFLAPVALLPLVNALQGVEYIVLLVFATILSSLAPHFVKEELKPKVIWQKTIAILCFGAGLALLAFTP